MIQRLKNKIGVLLLVIVTIGVLYFALKDDFTSIVDNILHINLWWLFVALFLVFGYWYMKAIVLHKTARHFKKDYRFRQAFRNILLTQFFNGITPFSSGGQPFQIYSLKQEGIDLTDGTNIIIEDFIVYQIALVLLGIIAVISNQFLNLYKEIGLLKQLVAIGFLINTVIIIVLFVVAFAKKANRFVIHSVITFLGKIKLVKDVEKKKEDWMKYINRFHSGAVLLMKDWKNFLSLIFLNFVALVSLYLIPMAIVYGFGEYDTLNGLTTIITSAYVMLIGNFVPIPGGTGGLEYSFLAFFGNFLTGSILKSVMLLWRFVTYYLGIIIGLIVFNIKGKR